MALLNRKVKASILPTVLTLCVVILLLVLSVYLLWHGSSFFAYKIGLRIGGYDDIESAFVLYRNDSTFMESFREKSCYSLYIEEPAAQVELRRGYWGAYEDISIKGLRGDVTSRRLYGNANGWEEGVLFYYPDSGNPITVTGYASIKGKSTLPIAGIRSSQIESEFFSGKIVTENSTTPSKKELPPPVPEIESYIKELLQTPGRLLKIDGTEELAPQYISELDQLPIDAILIARSISVKAGARIQGQLFATDSIIIGAGASLKYPSGIYVGGSEKNSPYIEVANGCSIDGYIILQNGEESSYSSIQYKQAAQATLSGLLYVDGTAKIEGVVKGVAMAKKVVYTSKYHYYSDTFYNTIIEENSKIVYPAWLPVKHLKREIKWLNEKEENAIGEG